MNKAAKNFCFCTLAVGSQYRNLAQKLAQDIEKFSPETSFVILTDNPEDFINQKNVLAFKHRQQGITCYHDKRFVISQALSLFPVCIFIDADMRILDVVPPDMVWLPGITARSCYSIVKHYSINRKNSQKSTKDYQVIQNLANQMNINLEEVKFVHEFLFTVTKDSGKELEFLEEWDKIAPYFELNGVYSGEGSAMGLAAAKVGLPINYDYNNRFLVFKDRVEKHKINQGEEIPEAIKKYLEEQNKLEYPRKPLVKKIRDKITKTIGTLYRKTRLRVKTLVFPNSCYK
ncbi:MAG: hypothetical protein ACRCU2_06740 [Planktothrix sp.]